METNPETPILKFPTKEKLTKLAYGLIFFLFTWIIFIKCKRSITKEKKEKKDLIRIQIAYIFCGIILGIGTIISLSISGVSKITLLSLFGFMGIAIGLSLQPTLTKIISSFELVFQNNYKIGDKISYYNPVSKIRIDGTITDFNLWNTVIKTSTKEEYIIPNDMINNNIVIK